MKHANPLKMILVAVIGAFSASSWSQITTFDYTGSIETYTVPVDVTMIQIEVRGAQGGNDGGQGAIMIGDFTVSPGDEFSILVGQEGQIEDMQEAGGGGGSFVADAADEPVIVAGGGGGIAWDGAGSPPFIGADANTTTNGNDGYGSTGGSLGRIGLGGIDGNGSTLPGPDGMGHAGNGGGFYTSGLIGACGPPGLSFLAGGAGGVGCSGGSGGFGGGANAGNWGGGGGGGYSGGGGAWHAPTNGGGGGSFNSGDNQDNSVGNTGNGQIIITVLCNALTVTATAEEICLGETFTLTGTGEGEVSWDGGVVNGEEFEPMASGVFTYTATSDDDEDCPYTIEIEVFALPEVTASVDVAEICEGESVVLTGGGADEYEWFPLAIIDGEAYTPGAGEYVYTVIGTDDETGCDNFAEVEVTVHALPEVVATISDAEICLGESVALNGEGASTYVWDPAETDGVAFTPVATGTTTYEVVGTDVNGCVNMDEVELTVYDELEITYTTTEEILGDDGEINITVTGGSTPYAFDWDVDGTGDFDDDEDLTDLDGGSYTVVVMCEAGCEATATIDLDSQVGIDENSDLLISVYPNPTVNEFTIQLEGIFSYSINAIDGQLIQNGTGFNTANLSLADYANGTYIVEVSNDTFTKSIQLIKQ